MFKTIAELLMHGQLKFEEGHITLLDLRMCMLPFLNIVILQKSLESKNMQNILYFANKEFGKQWTKKIYGSYKTKEGEIFKWGVNSITLSGWGIVELIENINDGKTIKFRLKDSGMVTYYGKSLHPIDHIFRGMVAGAMSSLYGVDMDAIELCCKAQGKEYCEFIVKPSKEFNRRDPLVKRQLMKPVGR